VDRRPLAEDSLPHADPQARFRVTTGLMLVEISTDQLREERYEVPACHVVCKLAHKCPHVRQLCAERFRAQAEALEDQPLTSTCWAGLSITLLQSPSEGHLYLAGQAMIKSLRFSDLQRLKRDWKGDPEDWERLSRQIQRSKTVSWDDYQRHIQHAGHLAQEGKLSERGARSGASPIPPGITRLCERLDHEFAETWSLARAASVACMSEYHFCRLFKATKGVTLGQYLTDLRVKKAQELLSREEHSVTEVAFAVGFQSISQFNRSFKSTTSMSPSAFRKQLSGG